MNMDYHAPYISTIQEFEKKKDIETGCVLTSVKSVHQQGFKGKREAGSDNKQRVSLKGRMQVQQGTSH